LHAPRGGLEHTKLERDGRVRGEQGQKGAIIGRELRRRRGDVGSSLDRIRSRSIERPEIVMRPSSSTLAVFPLAAGLLVPFSAAFPMPSLQGGYCGTPKPGDIVASPALVPGDCDLSSNDPDPAYAPSDVREIVCVFHVIHRPNGEGYVPPSKVDEQVRLTNEQFRAWPGGSGELGVDTRIRFRLASVDPSGLATNGITYTAHDGWYLDQPGYWTALAWDPTRYLNVYVNTAGPFGLGYVPSTPQQGGAAYVGTPADRVVVDWTALGENAPCGWPFDGGKLVTHELGHYLGLFDCYGSGCDGPSCHTSGDLICDTFPSISNPLGSCTPSTSCGAPSSVDNYMGAGAHSCQARFTEEQARRMRCTLDSWRPTVWTTVDVGSPYCPAQPNSTGSGARLRGDGSVRVSDDDLALLVDRAPAFKSGLFLLGSNAASTPFGDGILCVAGQIQRVPPPRMTDAEGRLFARLLLHAPPLSNVASPGATTRFQFWFRDPAGGPAGVNLSNGLTIAWQ
jgi:hypothetical protein